jgi:DNA-binding transcriptional MerR regulator
MKKVFSITTALAGILAASFAYADDAKIAQAVTPLPEDLKAGATVYDYDEDGNRVILREGTNHVECKPRDENGFTMCWPTSTAARRDYSAKLAAEGLEGEELQAALQKAEEEGIVEPFKAGTMLYRAYDNDDRIQLLWVVLLPGATAENLAMSLESQRDPALAGMGRPWMMREGTPGAHLMIPINGTERSNANAGITPLDTKALYEKDPVAHAVLPLPEDLRDGAQVVTYDESGNRKVLREGSNMIECATRDEASGFTRCYHKDLAAQADMRAKLTAQGMSMQEVGAAINEARENGELPTAPYGSMMYRLYEEDDRLKLLWVMRIPGATAEELGMSTASQRDPSLAGQGLPWMMREGTEAAHLMIPINGTELSNRKM